MTDPNREDSYPDWVQTEGERKLHDDFRYFLWYILKHLKKTATKRQLQVAVLLQHGPRRHMIQGFRGLGKSWITAAFVLWVLYRDPNERILVVSANEYKATEFATFTRRLIDEVEILHFLRPRGTQRDSVLAFDVGPSDAAQAPSVRAAGIFGQITGGRASLIVPDDIEVPKNSLTQVMRERLAEAIKEFDAVLVPGGRIKYLGTPQTEESVYRVLPGRGYQIDVIPARYPTDLGKYEGTLLEAIREELGANPKLAGHTTDPERFSDLDLAEREASYGASGFALQFMLDTSLSDAERYPLKTADFICLDVDDEKAPAKLVWTSDPRMAIPDIDNLGFNGDRLYRPMHTSETLLDYQGRILVVDPSGRGKDETAYVVLYHMGGMIYLRATGGFTDGYGDRTLEGLANIAKQHQVNRILVENNFGDGMFAALLKPHLTKIYPCTVEEVRATGQKEVRIIDDLEPVLNQHRLVIDTGTARKDAQAGVHSLLYQLTHITRERGALRHDDRVDCLAHGVRYFLKVLQQDAASVEAAHLEKLRDQEMAEFRAKWYGRAMKKPRFMSTNRGVR